MKTTESKEKLIEECRKGSASSTKAFNFTDPTTRALSTIEKQFLLTAEKGDCAGVRSIISENKNNPEEFDINCVDPLNRSALIAAIENENLELMKILIEEGIKVKDSLLHAIEEEYVEGVELLLQFEEDNHKPGEQYSWENVDKSAATFTPDITPLILAAHKNNYEIIKILLDRGASLPMPHDIRCACDECDESLKIDSLRHSQARMNAYKALTASSLISLSSKDPVLTAFELSWELRSLSRLETEFREQYNEMRASVQEFAKSLLDYVRSSGELTTMLNYDTSTPPWEPGDHMPLDRLKLAIKYKQKMFVAHASVQQLLGSLWYEGLPGFRRKGLVGQLAQVVQLAVMFPMYCTIYMIAPYSKMGLFMKKPFVKFICHSSSYALFLMLLGAASQRLEIELLNILGNDYIKEIVKEWNRKERGALPGFAECGVILYVISLIWAEVKSLWDGGLMEYISDLWNIVDFVTNMFYVMWLFLRFSAIYIVWREGSEGKDPYYPREQWHMFDPMLLSEGAFAAGMIFSFLKLVHIFSVNPHLGPLQISLGRMIIDIVKFFFIYTLVLFAFGCGLNQLLWYYSELEKNKCYHLPSGLPDFDNNDKACTIWRRYSNLFETSQSLFWASFGLVDLVSFELTGIKGFTRFWALLMFGSYSVINVIVLLNMLIAMMSNSYQIISERSDSEWKFARTRLWISYFDDGDTLPPPFNIFPTIKHAKRSITCGGNKDDNLGKSRGRAREAHECVMKLLVRRYVTAEQRKRDEFGVTEDDIMEVRQDVSTFRYELIDILRQNGMITPKLNKDDLAFTGKKGRVMERRLLKDFHIGIVEGIVADVVSSMKEPKDVFSQLARAMGRRRSSKDWNALVRRSTLVQDPIGSTSEAEAARRNRQSLRKHILTSKAIDDEKLLEYNPRLSAVPKRARVAYAKFMRQKLEQDEKAEEEINRAESTEATVEPVQAKKEVPTEPADSLKTPNGEKRTLSPIIASPTPSEPEKIEVVSEVPQKTPPQVPRRKSSTGSVKKIAPSPPQLISTEKVQEELKKIDDNNEESKEITEEKEVCEEKDEKKNGDDVEKESCDKNDKGEEKESEKKEEKVKVKIKVEPDEVKKDTLAPSTGFMSYGSGRSKLSGKIRTGWI
ncbi:transient receptor potential protein [Onthophagus taurus]|uniref:transient receptor potential protein n=1 Tax=Onthophagus taurus TaxID=166361 RepID=UPI0039BE7851